MSTAACEVPMPTQPEDFTAFYRRELGGQVRRATLLIGDEHVAQDLVHDAFAEVYVLWDTLDDPGPYLSVAVLNGCRNRAPSYRCRRSQAAAAAR